MWPIIIIMRGGEFQKEHTLYLLWCESHPLIQMNAHPVSDLMCEFRCEPIAVERASYVHEFCSRTNCRGFFRPPIRLLLTIIIHNSFHDTYHICTMFLPSLYRVYPLIHLSFLQANLNGRSSEMSLPMDLECVKQLRVSQAPSNSPRPPSLLR